MSLYNELKFILNNQNTYNIDETINKIIKLFESQDWIDISEQLPPDHKLILVKNEYGIHLAEYKIDLDIFIEQPTLKLINNIKKWKLV